MAIFAPAPELVLPPTLMRPGPTSLLLLCAVWEAVTWGSWALARLHTATVGGLARFRASLPALLLGRLADGLLLLSCALLCWSLGGSWSTMGRGFVPDFAPPKLSDRADHPAIERGPTLSFDSIQAQLRAPDDEGRQPGPTRTALRNKLLWGFRLDGVLALGFALAALCKSALGLWLLRVGLRRAGPWRLAGLVPLGLAIHVDAQLAALWWG